MTYNQRKPHLPQICIIAGLFALLPYMSSAAGPLPIAVDPTRIELAANPGEHIESSFNFWNGTDGGLQIHSEAADIGQSDDLGHASIKGEAAANSLKAWVKLEYPDLSVAPKEDIALHFAIDVPANADPGTHWGAILVTTAPGEVSGASIQVRSGVILLVRISGASTEKLTLEHFSVPHVLETPAIPVEALFRNEGTVHEAPDGEVEVRNMFGALVATGTLPVRNVLPGAARKINMQVDGEGFWLGRYSVSLDANYGSNNETFEASALVWIVPWREYGLWLLVLVALIAFLVWRRERLPVFWYILKNGVPPPETTGTD